MSILVNEQTAIIVQGITGREAVSIVQDSLAYGARIVGGVTPGKKGTSVYGVPVFDCVSQITQQEAIDVSIVCVPPPFVRDAAFEAMLNGIPMLVIITERVPRLDVAQILEAASMHGTRVIGPNSMGLISPGKTKVGSIGGPPEDTRKSYVAGPVGVVSKSGGMTTEISSLLTQSGLGQSTAISMGGDPLVGTNFVDFMTLLESDPQTEAMVIFGEPGGGLEAALASHVKQQHTRLPIVAFIAGRFVDEMPGTRFGHAGSIVEGKQDTTAEKIRVLREAGIQVAGHLSEIPVLVREGMKRHGHVH